MTDTPAKFSLSLTAQVMALVLGAVIAAQAITILAVYLAPPFSPPIYTLAQLASALKGDALATDQGRQLHRTVAMYLPEELADSDAPDGDKGRLAAYLGAPADEVRLHRRGPPPFVMLMSGNRPYRRDLQMPPPPDGGGPGLEPRPGQGGPPAMDGGAIRGEFVAAWRQGDGRWAIVEPQPELEWLRRLAIWVGGGLVVMGPIGFWFARRISAPLNGFVASAEVLGRDPQASLMAPSGPAEIGAAARAFNAMQGRIQRYVQDRVSMIGAISHDLRTPLTRIRFKVENADPAMRAAVLSDVAQMEHMISAVIAFSRDSATTSARQPLDLTSLVACAVDDAAAGGADARMKMDQTLIVDGDPVALQRLFANLIDNAIKYGQCAQVRAEALDGEAVVTVTDCGPGLPQRELETVFTPFYRTEEAKLRTASGVGLGLSIARSVARGHGGDIALTSSAAGLVASVTLPLSRGPRGDVTLDIPNAPCSVRPLETSHGQVRSQRPSVPNRSRCIRLRRSALVAQRSCLPALWRDGSHRTLERQDHAAWPVQVLRLQKAVYGSHRYDL
jgi:signal transduction histidine kinase